jgi:hypothetical protein
VLNVTGDMVAATYISRTEEPVAEPSFTPV